jgi:superfamily I DNA/RNA helicase
LRRNQVLVDEATDFSPVQLACMRALASPATDSFFASGDFNQRLTRWGSRSEEDLLWVSRGLTIERIDVSYRQSRRLAKFARALGQAQGYEINDRAPDHMDNVGYQPVLGLSLASLPEQARWLASRIREINDITDSALPTIAVLVCSAEALEPLAAALTEELRAMNIQAVACPKGMVKGQAGDVRIFEVEHIKGLEFEAVFFTDLDKLKIREPDLFDRYVYVGATRAATFLGLTCAGEDLPSAMEPVVNFFEERWP